ncbi:MAG: response regulator transcription factor [Anaeroplasma sp.]
MIKILVVEDDFDLNELLTSYLKASGFEVYNCYDGTEALSIFNELIIDIILSDIMLPNLNGYDLAIKIREKNKKIPIIFMSAKDDKPSKQIGYKVGIDDYITKPFDLDELVFKINAIVRRLELNSNNTISIKNLTINKEEHSVVINNEEVQFTVREFDILYEMLSNPKKTYTRSRLMEDFWGFDSSATSRTVDVYLSRLREKTKECDGFEIQTVHGLGYRVILK